MTSPLSMASQIILNGDHVAPNDSDQVLQGEGDNRSSSLSDLGERAEHDEAENGSHDISDANDTEAETERLEDTPQKLRKHQNVVLTSANSTYDDRPSPPLMPTLPELPVYLSPRPDMERLDPTSDISSLVDSTEENENPISAVPLSPRKRKYSSVEHDSQSEQETPEVPIAKSTKIFRNSSAGTLVETASPIESGNEEDNHEIVADTATIPPEGLELKKSSEPMLSKEQRYTKGKRKGRKIRYGDRENVQEEEPRADSPSRIAETHDLIESNDEDMENDDAGDVQDVDHAVKADEEGDSKMTALNTLNAMEKCFATLRDKLFDERLAQCNEELAMLDSPVPTHPELIAMKDVIDQRRDQKVQYEQSLLKYKLQSLQRESVANKAQILSQYMQTTREVRDFYLEKLNEKFYQLQRERRSVEEDVPDYMFTFSAKRSEQITQQTAYNSEVSILSGVAKHVGFPSAPEITTARPKEIEDDLRSMGISTQVPQRTQKNPPLLRAMTTSSFPRQRSGADEQFLEQNPWANPQHPSHQQQRQQLHRQASALSRAATLSSTPAAQRRVVDLTEPHDSASTVADHPSGPNSTMKATPATNEATRITQPGQINPLNRKIEDYTPSRIPGSHGENTSAIQAPFGASTDKGKASHLSKANVNHSPSLPKNLSQDTQNLSALPKPLPFTHTSGSTPAPGLRTSTPGRFSVIKAEDHGHISRRSPMPRFQTPPVSTVPNGSMNRFAA